MKRLWIAVMALLVCLMGTAQADVQDLFEEIGGFFGIGASNGGSEGEPSAKESELDATGVTPEFKALMDDYEAFFDDYVAMMAKIDASDGSDFTWMMDYAAMLDKYSEWMTTLDEIDEDDLSATDWAYFIAVQAKVNKKLLEAGA